MTQPRQPRLADRCVGGGRRRFVDLRRGCIDVPDSGYGLIMTNYRVNDAGVDKARQMIDAHQYDIETPWSDDAPDADDGNAQIERHGYDGFGEWHLGIDTDATPKTKDRYGFPFGDFSRVNRSALIHAKQRASQNDHDEIEAAADELLGHLDEVRS